MNPQEEKLLFKKVKNRSDFRDLDRVTYTDKPDVIAYLKTKKIGIEITECFQDDNGKGSKLREIRSFKNKVGNSLIYKLNDIKPCFHLSLDINVYVSNDGFNLLILRTEKFLRDKINKPQNNTSINFNSNEIEIEGLERISLFFTSDLNKSFFGESDYGGLPLFTNKSLNTILNKKEQKIKGYCHCDEYWLLIREGDMIAGSFSKIELEDFNSIYSKIFMYRIFSDELIILKNN